MKAINFTDSAGNVIFYMYLVDDLKNCTMTLHFSVDRKLISTKNTEILIACIEERRVPEDLRQNYVEELFQCIKKECIEKLKLL